MPQPVRNAAAKKTMLQIGARIRWVREELNPPVSQSELARVFGTTQSKWSKYESGTTLPDPLAMIEFCYKMRVTMDYIYRGILPGCDHDLSVRLAALHPELVLGHGDKEPGTGIARWKGTAPTGERGR